MDHLYTHEYMAPIGRLYLGVDRQGTVHRISFNDFRKHLPLESWSVNKYACGELKYQLDEYFRGERKHFSLEKVLTGTDFQIAVWERLTKIAYGTTISYGEIAQKIGRRHAARAVGRAVGANPIVIVVPCHRVIHTDGALGNYAHQALPADQGREIKKKLLELER